MRKWSNPIVSLLASLCLPSMVLANEAVMPIITVMGLSISLGILFFVLVVLAIVIIETVVLFVRLKIRIMEAFALSAVANIFSTVLGGLSIWVSTLGNRTRLFYSIICALGFVVLLGFFIRDSGHWNAVKSPKVSRPSPFGVILGVFVALFVFWAYYVRFHDAIYQYTMWFPINVLVIGFVLSLIAEGFVVGRWMSKRSKKILSTVVIMNGISYLALTVLTSIFPSWPP